MALLCDCGSAELGRLCGACKNGYDPCCSSCGEIKALCNACSNKVLCDEEDCYKEKAYCEECGAEMDLCEEHADDECCEDCLNAKSYCNGCEKTLPNNDENRPFAYGKVTINGVRHTVSVCYSCHRNW